MTGGNTVTQTLSRVQTSHSTGTATLSYDIIMKILMPLKLSCRRHEEHLIMTRVVLYPCWIRHLLIGSLHSAYMEMEERYKEVWMKRHKTWNMKTLEIEENSKVHATGKVVYKYSYTYKFKHILLGHFQIIKMKLVRRKIYICISQ